MLEVAKMDGYNQIMAKHMYWETKLLDCCKEPIVPIMWLIIPCCAVPCAQCMALSKIHSQLPTPFLGWCLTSGCMGNTSVGSALCRSSIRAAIMMPTEFWPDCAAYNSGMCSCCMAAQELYAAKHTYK